MRIEKNADGSYALTYCEDELQILGISVGAFLDQTKLFGGEIDGKYLNVHTHIAKVLNSMIVKFADATKDQVFNRKECQNCAALFDDDHPKCKANQ